VRSHAAKAAPSDRRAPGFPTEHVPVGAFHSALSSLLSLATRDARLRARGLITTRELGHLIDSKPNLVYYWRHQGLLKGVRLNERNEYYYERPSPEIVEQIKQRRGLVAAQPVS
jgi:hypothetical protein